MFSFCKHFAYAYNLSWVKACSQFPIQLQPIPEMGICAILSKTLDVKKLTVSGNVACKEVWATGNWLIYHKVLANLSFKKLATQKPLIFGYPRLILSVSMNWKQMYTDYTIKVSLNSGSEDSIQVYDTALILLKMTSILVHVQNEGFYTPKYRNIESIQHQVLVTTMIWYQDQRKLDARTRGGEGSNTKCREVLISKH